MTTSFAATLHLDFSTAFRAHPFGPFFYLLFTCSALACGFGWLRGARFNTDSRQFNRAMMAMTLAFVAFGVVRFGLVQYDSPEFAQTQTALKYSR